VHNPIVKTIVATLVTASLLGACQLGHPQPDHVTDDGSVLTRPSAPPDSTVAYGDGPDQVADIRFAEARGHLRPLVIILHGGFWKPAYDRAHVGPMAETLAAAGWTVAAAEYRRTPGNPDATLEDVALIVERLAKQVSHHNGRVVLIGHSAGGHLALWAASTSRDAQIVGVLALAPVADLQMAYERNLGSGAVLAFLGAPPATRKDVDPRLLPAPAAATTILHGDQDDTVPLAAAESYVAAHSRTRLVRLANVGHFALIDPLSAAWSAVLDELRRLAPDDQA
jgi:acetyl esterase/lipase